MLHNDTLALRQLNTTVMLRNIEEIWSEMYFRYCYMIAYTAH